MASIRSCSNTVRSRFLLRVCNRGSVGSLSICIDDLSRNTVLFDWRGAEARCLLESHDLLRRHAMDRRAGYPGIPISKTSIWHLALHAAAIRCLLNRSYDVDMQERWGAASTPTTPATSDGKLYDNLPSRILRLLRADRCNALSAHDITCLLALEGFACTPTCIRQALDDLVRWGFVNRTAGEPDDEMFTLVPTASARQNGRGVDPSPAREAIRPAWLIPVIN